MIPRFYTNAPVNYPYLLVNIKDIKTLKTRCFKHGIIDIGIHDLLDKPYSHSEIKLHLWESLNIPNTWKVVPDVPDIDREFNLKTDLDNVKESRKLLRDYYNPLDSSHLPVIQGYYHDPNSFFEYGKWFLANYKMPDKIGIGTICKAGDIEKVKQTIFLLRKLFPKTWIHVFGLKMNHFKPVSRLINSYDSMAWTFPRGRGRGSCKNKEERIEFFQNYLETIPKYLNPQRSLDEFNVV